MELSNELEQFIRDRIETIDYMPEGEDKEKAIKNLVELMKANSDNLRTVYQNSLEMARLDSNETLEREKLVHTKELELLRFEHENKLEELRASYAKEQKRLEKTGAPEKVFQYALRVCEIGVPVGLFVVATAIENENGFINSMSKTLLTKLPLYRK